MILITNLICSPTSKEIARSLFPGKKKRPRSFYEGKCYSCFILNNLMLFLFFEQCFTYSRLFYFIEITGKISCCNTLSKYTHSLFEKYFTIPIRQIKTLLLNSLWHNNHYSTTVVQYYRHSSCMCLYVVDTIGTGHCYWVATQLRCASTVFKLHLDMDIQLPCCWMAESYLHFQIWNKQLM